MFTHFTRIQIENQAKAKRRNDHLLMIFYIRFAKISIKIRLTQLSLKTDRFPPACGGIKGGYPQFA